MLLAAITTFTLIEALCPTKAFKVFLKRKTRKNGAFNSMNTLGSVSRNPLELALVTALKLLGVRKPQEAGTPTKFHMMLWTLKTHVSV